MKKTLAILMAALMLLSLTACSSAPEATTEPAATAEQTEQTEQTAAPAEEKQSYTVGICQLVQHPALDAATQGFKDVLTEQLGDSVTIEEGNASNDIPTCATIVNGFVSSEVDLIMANATPALQAAVAATNTIPILGTSVTEYGVALNISDFSGTVGGNVSGTSDLAPLDQQAAMVKELFPDAKTVGILYCSGEANSVYQANVVKECLEADGLTVNIFTFADSNDVSTVTTSAVAESDVLYIPTDNTAASCTEAIAAVTVPAGVPVIAGEEGICKGCGVATLSISYYDLGRTTGEMAVKILKGEADISEMPVEYFQGPVKKFNKDMAEKLNVTIPDEYVAIED
ncbi:MAG: ABC transporter substrate-binding protein [Christensenellales bacterium]